MQLEVSTHDNEVIIVTVEEYDPIALNESLNDTSLNTVVIGDLIISRINLKKVNPFEVLSV